MEYLLVWNKPRWNINENYVVMASRSNRGKKLWNLLEDKVEKALRQSVDFKFDYLFMLCFN